MTEEIKIRKASAEAPSAVSSAQQAINRGALWC